ncbi:MAG: hypothetical protein ACI9LM_003420 [Alteromonadaceae bacterium]
MILIRFVIFTIFPFYFINSAYAYAEQVANNDSLPIREEIIWLLEDKKENINLLEKVSPDTSVATYIESKIVSQLSDYNIKINRVSMKRIDSSIKNTPNSCAANRAKIKTREEYSLFSTPQSFYITHKLYRFNRSHSLPAPLLNEQGEVIAIKDIFKHFPKAKIGIADGISFGPFLDGEIEQISPQNIHYRGGSSRVTALEAMLYSQRIDYLIALPIDIVPTNDQKALLEKYTIAGAPPYLIAHFSCSKSKLGERVIDDINHLLKDIYQTQDYYRAHQRWFTEQELIDLQGYLQERYANDVYLKKP